ncbi:MAG: hemerythrin domain-containing protein [Bacteroidetes bacterium]|nr:MAG: hemerythrin domain-containing protein [Bacteroidota bacterium]
MINIEESLKRGTPIEILEKLQGKEVLKKLQGTEPVKKDVEKGLEDTEHSPMDPPSAYEQPGKVKVSFDTMDKSLLEFVDEHKIAMKQVEDFEKALVQFKTSGYKVDQKMNEIFSAFFKYFDTELLPHNDKEEKTLFPLLNKRLIEAGEHSKGDDKLTAIDVMEDDHVKFIQLGALAFNFFGLATRIKDEGSRIFILDTAYETARELIELLKLHIYREDYTLFPLAQKYLSKEEFDLIEKKMHRH